MTAEIILTDQQIVEVEKLAKYLSLDQIADYLGVSRPTFEALRKRNPEIEERYKKGRAGAIERVVKRLFDKIEEGDTASIMFYLKTQANWSTKNDDIAQLSIKMDFLERPLKVINNNSNYEQELSEKYKDIIKIPAIAYDNGDI